MVSVKCVSDYFCLFSDTDEEEELTPKSKTGHISQITRTITAEQCKMMKDLGLSDCITFHTSKKGKTTMILKFPSEPCHPTLMGGLLCSLVSFTIHESVFRFAPYKCIKAILHFGCMSFLELYVQHMKELSISRAALVHCLNIIVEQFGFSFENSMMDILFDMLDQRGVSKDFLKLYLKHDKKLDITKLIESVKSLPPGWSPFLDI